MRSGIEHRTCPLPGAGGSGIGAAAMAALLAVLAPVPALAGGGASAAATPPVATITPVYFGMTAANPKTSWPAVSFGTLAKGNCVQWPSLEASRGTYTWTALDNYLSAAQAHGTTFTYSPGTIAIPQWATSNTGTCVANACGTGAQQCGAPPANEQDLKDFFGQLGGRYCTQMVYELWNEPWGDANMTPAQLATVTTDEENAIRAACPGAQFVSPSFSGVTADVTYMQQYYAAGGPTDLLAATLHIYTNGAAPVDFPESINPATGHGIDYGNVVSTLNQYLPGKPVWMTEGSWGNMTQSQDFTTAATQAGFIARWYLIQWSLGFQRSSWYEYDNAGFGPLKPSSRSDGSSVPQTAYQQTYNWLLGRQMTQPCSSPTMTATTAVWTCGLAGAGGYQALAAWITQGSQSYTPPSASTYTQYRDLAGTVHPYSGGAVTITTSPILFEN